MEAFGEDKGLTDWAADERCVVSKRTLTRRLASGFSLEQALTTPAKKRDLAAFGETKTLGEWLKDPRCLVGRPTLVRRLDAGWDAEEALSLAPIEETTISAFGEAKSFTMWEADERCTVDRHTLYTRIGNGWDAEEAIITPSLTGTYSIEAFGETKTISEWAEDQRCVLTREGLATRLRSGWEPEAAISTPTQLTYEAFGKSLSLDEWIKQPECVIDLKGTLASRLYRGWSIEDAMTTELHEPSYLETQFADFCENLGVPCVRNDRSTLVGKELDIYFPKHRLAIEFNGLYWHSNKFKPVRYHKDKKRSAAKAGVNLIFIWEDDWLERRSIVENLIKHKLGISESNPVGARKCSVVDVDKETASLFLETNHIQGSVPCSIIKGLRFEGDLVALAGFRKHKEGLELTRYATSRLVQGGFSKLISSLEYNGRIVSFASEDISNGDLYTANGWTETEFLQPDYMYVVNGRRVHKFNYRKARFESDPKLLFEPGLTERELAELNGLLRVYDSGKRKFILDNSV